MYILLVVLGFLPFAVGGFINWLITTYENSVPPFILIGIIFLLVWGIIAYLVKPHIKSSKETVICLNSVAFVVLILLGIQELVLRTYWSNFIGILTQFYYLPLLRISFILTSWSHSIFAIHCAAFIMMVAASALGCRLQKK